jgi:hypothetical protein
VKEIYQTVDYWIPQVTVTGVEGGRRIVIETVWHVSSVARNLRMLAHFRALDRDDD